ncbi:MAG: GDSL-type esterase/lipase family protein [Chthoniobacteraceae bacterium]
MLKHILLPMAALLVTWLAPAPVQAQTPAPTAPIRVACVGDSITFGYLLKDRAHDAYPAVLQGLLGPGWQVGNFGVSGCTLLKAGDRPYWKQKALQQALSFAPQIVVIQLGTNDTKPQNFTHEADFAGDAAALVELFTSPPPHPKVWLCLPVPIYGNKMMINEQNLESLIAKLRQVALDKSLPIIDLHSALAGHEELFPDGVHPNPAGARLMAEAVAKALQAAEPSAAASPAN